MDLFPVCVCANKVKVAEFVMTAQFLISNTYNYQLHAMHVQCALNELGLSACLFMCVFIQIIISVMGKIILFLHWLIIIQSLSCT